jgi:hypothetical protein
MVRSLDVVDEIGGYGIMMDGKYYFAHDDIIIIQNKTI